MQLNLMKSEDDEYRYMADIREYAEHQKPSVHLFCRTKVLIDLVKS